MKDAEIFGKDSGGTLRSIRTSTSGNSLPLAAGDVAHDAVDSGNPLKIGGIARTANPTAVTALDRVDATFDAVGRQLIYPYQVRDLISTAKVDISSGTQTTLLAGIADTFLDLVQISFANDSTVAEVVDVFSAVNGGSVVTIQAPANDTITIHFPTPIPQNEAGDSWSLDMNDVTGTTIRVSALFVQNV